MLNESSGGVRSFFPPPISFFIAPSLPFLWDRPHMTSAKFSEFFDPDPPVRIQPRCTIKSTQNPPYYICFWGTPPPPPRADVIFGWPLSSIQSPIQKTTTTIFLSHSHSFSARSVRTTPATAKRQGFMGTVTGPLVGGGKEGHSTNVYTPSPSQ